MSWKKAISSLVAAAAMVTLGAASIAFAEESPSQGPALGHRPANATPYTGPDPLGGVFSRAECTADCGDGTGWRCTGASVTCVDGAGCDAFGSDGSSAHGRCAQ